MDVESIHQAECLVRQANHALADGHVGITATQAAALAFIGKQPRTMHEVADHSGVTPAVVTGLVDRLERSGFVRRIPGVHDRRVVVVQITEAGRIALDNAAQAFADYQAAKELVAA